MCQSWTCFRQCSQTDFLEFSLSHVSWLSFLMLNASSLTPFLDPLSIFPNQMSFQYYSLIIIFNTVSILKILIFYITFALRSVLNGYKVLYTTNSFSAWEILHVRTASAVPGYWNVLYHFIYLGQWFITKQPTNFYWVIFSYRVWPKDATND